jgi:imidazoleglycerol phosphate dehydratase HisB
MRNTRETRVNARVDLDCAEAACIATGIAFFDHMLAQVALHAGFSLTLRCEGDLDVDAHHTIEDCALALGEALRQALGERRGIARFGFVLPMDEAEAKVSLDLGGRAFTVFEGVFAAPLLGAYPSEMTEHVFRSLAQAMGCAIHVSVKGENDHHKTEACFKAFGRALRQAIRVDDETIASTKGVLA